MNKYLGGGILAGLGYVIYSLLGIEEETKNETQNSDKETQNTDKTITETQNTDKTITETQPETQPENINTENTETQETNSFPSTSTPNEVSSNITDESSEILEDLERNKVEIPGVSLDEADSNFLSNKEPESTSQIIDDDSKTIKKIIQV